MNKLPIQFMTGAQFLTGWQACRTAQAQKAKGAGYGCIQSLDQKTLHFDYFQGRSAASVPLTIGEKSWSSELRPEWGTDQQLAKQHEKPPYEQWAGSDTSDFFSTLGLRALSCAAVNFLQNWE